MGVIGLLVALFPRKWRASFGEEFAALLEETRLTPAVIIDVVAQAGLLHVRAHRGLVLGLAALGWAACCEVVSVRAGLTANILWAPSTPARAIALAATTGPWPLLAAAAAQRRRRAAGQAGPAR